MALVGPVADELAAEGIELIDSTYFLKDQLPQPGTLTKRKPDERERGDIEYGLEIAKDIRGLHCDIADSDRLAFLVE